MKRRTVYLVVLGILLAAALYFVFRIFPTKTIFPYAYEIAAAFMGALVTVVITMILLNRQSEVETLKERNVELLKQKILVYGSLVDRLEQIMRKGEVSLEDEIAIQMLNLKLSFFASTDVLQKLNEIAREFASQFSLVAADRKVTSYGAVAQVRRCLGQRLFSFALRDGYDAASAASNHLLPVSKPLASCPTAGAVSITWTTFCSCAAISTVHITGAT